MTKYINPQLHLTANSRYSHHTQVAINMHQKTFNVSTEKTQLLQKFHY